MPRFDLTDCMRYINSKIAHAIVSGENHRQHPECKDRSYKCTIRRDYAEAITQHLQAAFVAAEEHERALNGLRGRVRDMEAVIERYEENAI